MRSAVSIFGAPASDSSQYLLAVLVAVPVACLVGIDQAVPAMLLVVAVYIALFLTGMLRSAAPGRRDIAFWGMLVLLVVVSLWRRLIGNTLFGFSVSGFLELWLIILVPFALVATGQWIRESGFAVALLFLLLVFVTISILSTAFGKTHSLPGATYQLLSNLKFLLMLSVGFFLTWSERTDEMYWRLVRWLWVPLTVLVLWRWVSPSTYILSPNLYGRPGWLNDFEPHWLGLPSKSAGPFPHPLYMGYLSALLMLFSLIKGSLREHRSFLLVALCYLWLLLASGQKGEFIAALVAAPIVVGAIKGRRYLFPMIFAAAVAVFAAAWWAWDSEFLTHVVRSWGLSGDRTEISEISSTYGVMYWHAHYIANEFAPLGSGLATFAGVGAAKFDTSFYLERGFANYWWWDDRNVLTDTIWPNFVAESGWVGLFVIMLIILGLLAYAANQALRAQDARARQYWLMAFAGQLFTLGNSPTSAAHQNPGLFFFAIVFFGVAYNASRRARRSVCGPDGGRTGPASPDLKPARPT